MANVAKINGYDVKDAEARGDIADIQQDLSTAQGDITTLQGDVSDIEADLGDITALTTTVKTSAVNAINEVDSHADANTINIGNLAALNTVDKSDIVSAINEVESHASYGISKNTYNFAPTFSDETSYAVGDYVTYNGVLYKCTTAHTAGVWVAGHFTQVTVGGTLNDLRVDCPHLVYRNISNSGVVKNYTLDSNGSHYECRAYYYGGLCGLYALVRDQFGNNGAKLKQIITPDSNHTISVDNSTGVVSMAGTTLDNVEFVITKLP